MWLALHATRVALLIVGAAAIAGQLSASDGKEKVPFKPVDTEKTRLGADETAQFNKAMNKPERVGKVEVAELNKEALENLDGPLVIELPDGRKFEARDCKVTRRPNGNTTVSCKDRGARGSITVSNQGAMGTLYYDDKVYTIEPLGKGIHAIYQIDQSKFKDHPPAAGKAAAKDK